MVDGGVEFYDVEAYEVVFLFICYGLKPFDYGGCVFPLVDVSFCRYFVVDSVKYSFAYLAYFGFSQVD